MEKYELILDSGYTIGIDSDFSYTIESNIFGSFGSIYGMFTNDFDINITNDTLFELGSPEIDIYSKSLKGTKIQADLYYNNELIDKGFFALNYIDNDSNTINITYTSNNSNWIDKAQDVSIRDNIFKYPEIEHERNIVTVNATFDSNWNGKYHYPLVNTGLIGDNIMVNYDPNDDAEHLNQQIDDNPQIRFCWQDLLPAVENSYILEKVFKTFGYHVKGDLLSNSLFLNSVLFSTDQPKLNEEDFEDIRFVFNKPLVNDYFYAEAKWFNSINPTDRNYIEKFGCFDYSITDTSTISGQQKKFFKAPNGKYDINLEGYFTIETAIYNSLILGGYTDNDILNKTSLFYFEDIDAPPIKYRNDWFSIDWSPQPDNGTKKVWKGVASAKINVVIGNGFSFVVYNPIGIINTDLGFSYNYLEVNRDPDDLILQTCFLNGLFYNYYINSGYLYDIESTKLKGNWFLGEIQVDQFIKWITATFCTIITTDENTKTVYFNQLKNIQLNDSLDWSDKVSVINKVDFTEVVKDLGQKTLVQYSQDDEILTQFKLANKIGFGDGDFLIKNKNIENEVSQYESDVSSTIAKNALSWRYKNTVATLATNSFPYDDTSVNKNQTIFIHSLNYLNNFYPLAYIPIIKREYTTRYNFVVDTSPLPTPSTTYKDFVFYESDEIAPRMLILKRDKDVNLLFNQIFTSKKQTVTNYSWGWDQDVFRDLAEATGNYAYSPDFYNKVFNNGMRLTPLPILNRNNGDRGEGLPIEQNVYNNDIVLTTFTYAYFSPYNPDENLHELWNDQDFQYDSLAFKEDNDWKKRTKINQNDIINRDYRRLINIYNNPVFLECQMKLDATDLKFLSLNKLIYLNQTDSYYFIQRIEVSNDSDLQTVYLVKLIE